MGTSEGGHFFNVDDERTVKKSGGQVVLYPTSPDQPGIQIESIDMQIAELRVKGKWRNKKEIERLEKQKKNLLSPKPQESTSLVIHIPKASDQGEQHQGGVVIGNGLLRRIFGGGK